MRVQPFTLDSYVHVVKRGARGLPIVNDAAEHWRFLRLLFYMNDEYLDENWDQLTRQENLFHRPDWWPDRVPIVRVVGYTLMSNHMHLLLQEIRTGGVSLFMRRIGQSMTNHYNEKHKQRGSLFQGAYRSRTITGDEYLRYAAVYIMVKNSLELYPGGLRTAMKDFDKAWQWAAEYPFSSLGEYAKVRSFPVVDKDLLGEIYKNPLQFKDFSRDVLLGGTWLRAEFE